MYSVHDDRASSLPGFPIRKSPGQSLFSSSPKLIAAYRVLLRLPVPRHPPSALSSLTKKRLIVLSAILGTTITKYSIIKDHINSQRLLQCKMHNAECKITTNNRTLHAPIYTLHCRLMVEVNGIEPMTSCVQGRRSPS